MPEMSADEIADALDEIGARLELEGESAFKSRAYYRAASSLRSLDEPIDRLIAEDRLREIPGVGDAIEEKIVTLHRTGSHRTLEKLRQKYPAGVLELLDVPNLGPLKAAKLYDELGITSIAALQAAAEAGKLAPVKGLGLALQKKVLANLDLMERTRGQILLHHATQQLEAECERLRKACPELASVQPAGDVRRGCEVVSNLWIVGCLSDDAECQPPAMLEERVLLAPPDRHALALLFATGSDAHLQQLASYARERGLQLSPDGLLKADKPIPCIDEAGIYAALGLQFIPPELREGRGEIEQAARNELPNLVEEADLRGVLHSHTNASDGGESLGAMAEEVRRRGYEYYGVCDHSQSAGYAGGLKPERVRTQWRMVDALNRGYENQGVPFRILKGIESDILVDGSLDYPEEVLAGFDFIVASVHSRFTLEQEEQTRRIVRAVSNPYTTILGHMTGRLLLRREGYKVDVERVLEACAEYGVAVEINANPHRLDLDWRWHQRALELGCNLSINTDAHSFGELDMVRWGTLIARKGGVTADRLLSCWPLERLTDHLAARKGRPA